MEFRVKGDTWTSPVRTGMVVKAKKALKLRHHRCRASPSANLFEPNVRSAFMWPFSSSNPASQDKQEAEPSPTRESRAKCWNSRDEFFACLDASKVASPADRGDKCSEQAKQYETNCAKRWAYSWHVYHRNIDYAHVSAGQVRKNILPKFSNDNS